MLFIGTITRMIEGDRYKHNHAPAAFAPAAVSLSMPPQHAHCSCRSGHFCSACSTQGHRAGLVVPIIAATPVLSHHDARREWRYERRAMRDSRRAARHGHGYRHPIAIPVATTCAPDYYEAGPSQHLPGRSRDEYWEDDGSAAPAGFGESHVKNGQREISPPKYEVGSWDPRRTSIEVLTDGKGT